MTFHYLFKFLRLRMPMTPWSVIGRIIRRYRRLKLSLKSSAAPIHSLTHRLWLHLKPRLFWDGKPTRTHGWAKILVFAEACQKVTPLISTGKQKCLLLFRLNGSFGAKITSIYWEQFRAKLLTFPPSKVTCLFKDRGVGERPGLIFSKICPRFLLSF